MSPGILRWPLDFWKFVHPWIIHGTWSVLCQLFLSCLSLEFLFVRWYLFLEFDIIDRFFRSVLKILLKGNV